MPLSPSLRYPSGKGQRGEKHKRGRSLEECFLVKVKEDDLELFSQLQSRERENFLIQSPDDFDRTFSTKLKNLSDVKLGTAAQGQGSELLNAETVKNDYDWLLTPPDTPLFPSLDDEAPTVIAVSRGRPRSHPINISRSSPIDRSYTGGRGSQSPNRLSKSPGSVTSSTSQSRGLLSSSPTSSQRSVTPSRKPSPPGRTSTSAPRSSAPTLRKMSPASGNHGNSLTRTVRGPSASPKSKTWHSSIPGFPSDAPPNLRTSLTDRPATFVRGSSPTQRTTKESGSIIRRNSTSPKGYRNSQDIEQNCDNEFESHNANNLGCNDQLISKRLGNTQANRSPDISKKVNNGFSLCSAPKRSPESVVKKTENRRSPPNMFRPLLSSAPTSTFYAGRASSGHRVLTSRNSSETTSSSNNSDQCLRVALDAEGNEKQPECGKSSDVDITEELFGHHKLDSQTKTTEHLGGDNAVQHHIANSLDKELAPASEFVLQVITEELRSDSENVGVKLDFSEESVLELLNLCIRCGGRYIATENVDGKVNLCLNCYQQDNNFTYAEDSGGLATQSSIVGYKKTVNDTSDADLRTSKYERVVIDEDGISCSLDGRVADQVEKFNEELSKLSVFHGGSKPMTDTHHNEILTAKSDLFEGARVSELLKKTSRSKGRVFPNRSFSSTITYDDLLHARDCMRSFRSYGSTSASSSVDFSSGRLGEAPVQQHLALKRADTEIIRSASSVSIANDKSLGEAHAILIDNVINPRGDGSDTPGLLNSREVSDEKSQMYYLHDKRCDSKANEAYISDVIYPSNEIQSLVDSNVSNDAPPKQIAHVSLSEDKMGETQDAAPLQPDDKTDIPCSRELNSSDDRSEIPEKSAQLVNGNEEIHERSLSAEETTDAILLCSSLVNDILYHAAAIAAEKESAVLLETCRPRVTILGRYNAEQKEPRRVPAGKHSPKPLKSATKRKGDGDGDESPLAAENDENMSEAMVRNVGIPRNPESLRPPKLESKCNCVIM